MGKLAQIYEHDIFIASEPFQFSENLEISLCLALLYPVLRAQAIGLSPMCRWLHSLRQLQR